jgi:hypothetical protein
MNTPELLSLIFYHPKEETGVYNPGMEGSLFQ